MKKTVFELLVGVTEAVHNGHVYCQPKNEMRDGQGLPPHAQAFTQRHTHLENGVVLPSVLGVVAL